MSSDGDIEDMETELSLLKIAVCNSPSLVTQMLMSLSVFIFAKSGSQTIFGMRHNWSIPLPLLSLKNTPLVYLSMNKNILSRIEDFPTLFAPAISVIGLILSSVRS